MVFLRPELSCFVLSVFIAFSTISTSGSEIAWPPRNDIAHKNNPVDLLAGENSLSTHKRCRILRNKRANRQKQD